METLRIIISGGGTGGHIFPALAIAGEFKKRFPDADILFVGALGRMEMEKVPAAGFKIIGLPVMGFPRKTSLKIIRFLIDLARSILRARRIIREFKPDLAIGVGGFASGPLLRAATFYNVPILIQEQNSYAGITNKLLGKSAACICVAYEGMEKFFPKEKIILTGNPIRNNISIKGNKSESLLHFGINPGKKVVLITGGSLGARSINNCVFNNLEVIRDSEVFFIWQTGSLYFDEMVGKCRGIQPENLTIYKFLERMELAYEAADLIISRAGALTISELCVIGKPAILVPSPNVAEDHQTKNALALVRREAALWIRDDEIGAKLFPLAFDTLKNQDTMSRLASGILKMAQPGATAQIVDQAIKLIVK